MSADFFAGYASGSLGILVGNPLDIIKVRLQNGQIGTTSGAPSGTSSFPKSLLRGSAAPILGYGALNALLYMTYNRSLKLLEPSIFDPTKLAGVDLSKIWVAGGLGGLASWVVSAPSELIKCRAQLCVGGQTSSISIAKSIVKNEGLRGLYFGGVITSLRDSIGYGFYFWSYELTKRFLLSRQHDPFQGASTMDVLLSGGIAGVITWASIYPLDAIKTRLQAQDAGPESTALLSESSRRKGTVQIARGMFRNEGIGAFYRGLGVCSARAFVVNAVQVTIPPYHDPRLC